MKFKTLVGLIVVGMVVVLAFWPGLFTGTFGRGGQVRQAIPEIYVAAAASLADVLDELAKEFEERSGIRTRLDFASSGLLRTKLEAGARMDAFISASPKHMDLLEKAGYVISRTRRDVLTNRLACVVLADGEVRPDNPNDLLRLLLDQRIRWIAIGDPEHVPAGEYGKEALVRLGLWNALVKKLVPSADARATLMQIETGTVEAGIVYQTDAKVSPKLMVAFLFPQASHRPIVYPAAVLARSSNPDRAEAFLDFLGSGRGSQIFAAYGFRAVRKERD